MLKIARYGLDGEYRLPMVPNPHSWTTRRARQIDTKDA